MSLAEGANTTAGRANAGQCGRLRGHVGDGQWRPRAVVPSDRGNSAKPNQVPNPPLLSLNLKIRVSNLSDIWGFRELGFLIFFLKKKKVLSRTRASAIRGKT